MSSRNLFTELKRGNVIRAAILYLGAVWALAQDISQLGPSVGAPEWATRWFLAAGIGFPFWIAYSWFYEFTPEGLKRFSPLRVLAVGKIAAHIKNGWGTVPRSRASVGSTTVFRPLGARENKRLFCASA